MNRGLEAAVLRRAERSADPREIAPNLNLTVDYGFLWWLAVPLFYLLDWLHGFLGNWGVAIILLTVLVKLVLYPLSRGQLQVDGQHAPGRSADEKAAGAIL